MNILTVGLGKAKQYLLTLGYDMGIAAVYEKMRVTGATSLANTVTPADALAARVAGSESLV